MKSLKNLFAIVAVLAIFATLIALPSVSVSAQTSTNSASSAENSPRLDIPASDESLRRACAEAVQELKAARALINGQAQQIETAERLLKIQTEIESGLRTLNDLNAEQRLSLSQALEAKSRIITELESQNAALRKRGGGAWGKAKFAVIGVALGVIAGAVL